MGEIWQHISRSRDAWLLSDLHLLHRPQNPNFTSAAWATSGKPPALGGIGGDLKPKKKKKGKKTQTTAVGGGAGGRADD